MKTVLRKSLILMVSRLVLVASSFCCLFVCVLHGFFPSQSWKQNKQLYYNEHVCSCHCYCIYYCHILPTLDVKPSKVFPRLFALAFVLSVMVPQISFLFSVSVSLFTENYVLHASCYCLSSFALSTTRKTKTRDKKKRKQLQQQQKTTTKC